MIKFCFKRGSLFPFYPNEYEGCLGGCDHQLLQLLDLRSFRSVTCSNNTNINFNNSERVNARSTNPQPRNNEHTTIRSLSMTNENINCMCGEKVIELTVKKDGPNKGRQFYKCAKPAGSGCTTFVWKDEIVPDRIMQSNNTALIGTAENITCNCALPAKKTAVQKDGPNKGRLFYTCSKYAADKCRFFQWADESNTDVNHSRRNNNCRRTVNEPTRNNLRKCSNCGNQGHNRKTCPLNR